MGIDANFIPHYLITYCKNFIMVLPLQLIIVGPLARFIFRNIFLRKEKKAISTNEIQNEDEKILGRAENV